MSTQPTQAVQAMPTDDLTLEQIRTGQRLIIFAILANFIFAGIRADYPLMSGLVALVAVVMATVGLLRLASGLKYELWVKILLVILQFVPLVNIITLLVLSSRATKALRAAGYKVGLFGAAARSAP